MTPKEKAEELVKSYVILIRYDSVSDLRWHDPSSLNHEYHSRVRKDAKLFALRAVDEVINCLLKNDSDVKYWRDVKIKIKAITSNKILD
jgi:hypothetical protein